MKSSEQFYYYIEVIVMFICLCGAIICGEYINHHGWVWLPGIGCAICGGLFLLCYGALDDYQP